MVSLVGTWMQRIGQDWLILKLSHNNGVLLGVTTALQFLPYVCVGPYGGALADRYSKRSLLLITQSGMAAVAVSLAVLDLTGVIVVWHVCLLAAVLGIAAAVDSPVRQSFVLELVGPDDVINAVSLNSAIFNVGRAVGPALAGIVIAELGTGAVFIMNAGSFVPVIFMLFLIKPSQYLEKMSPSNSVRVMDGARYVLRNRQFLLTFILLSVTATAGVNNISIVASVYARKDLQLGPDAFGLLGTCFAIGSVLGAFGAARVPSATYRRLVLGSASLGIIECLGGIALSYVEFAVVLVAMGMACYAVITAANGMVQLAAPAGQRGRIMAMYLLAFFGPTPVVGVLIGYGLSEFGARWVLEVSGSVVVVVTLLVLWQWQILAKGPQRDQARTFLEGLATPGDTVTP